MADGFAERDEDGIRLQEEICEIARRENIRIIGPNTAGILNTSNGLNPCPYAAGYSSVKTGPVAICSQTGMINPQAFPYADTCCGFSKICDLGNKCDVDESDILEYLGNDPETQVISMHLESIKNGTRFMAIARKVTPSKPVLILKGGRTKEGANAAASHTGSMAVDDEIFHAVCKQAGIIRLEKFNELFELPKIFGYQPLPRGNRLAVVSFSGATGILSLDEGVKYGLSVAPFTSETEKILKDIFFILGRNPVDVGPLPAYLSSGDFMSNYGEIINAVITDNQVDSLFN
ncbi:MAG: hypothetical protein JXB42_03620 [Deltaproteobacteria bacterium]|nr:hypothetical protein [Deltaproteobacteria bacterium]